MHNRLKIDKRQSKAAAKSRKKATGKMPNIEGIK